MAKTTTPDTTPTGRVSRSKAEQAQADLDKANARKAKLTEQHAAATAKVERLAADLDDANREAAFRAASRHLPQPGADGTTPTVPVDED